MKTRAYILALVSIAFTAASCSAALDTAKVEFKEGKDKIDVLFDGNLITSYLYPDTMTKPVLYPVKTTSGIDVNRGYPLKKVEGESTDHPHHVGIFFTYDEVNDSGFWNNTKSPPQIKHVRTKGINASSSTSEGSKATISVVHQWIDKNSKPILKEDRDMVFHIGKDSYAIDMTMVLTALTDVEFGDTKEGMFAIRNAAWLKEKNGNSEYLSSNGDKKAGGCWGKRAEWVRLEGKKDDKTIGIAIMNHPDSVNYPTFWHARDYGLFAANPLGQYAFEKSKKVPNPKHFGLKLKKGESAKFRFSIIIYEGARTKKQLDDQFKQYKKQ